MTVITELQDRMTARPQDRKTARLYYSLRNRRFDQCRSILRIEFDKKVLPVTVYG